MEGQHAVEYVQEPMRFYNYVLCDAKPIFLLHGRQSPLSEVVDLRRISVLNADALQDAFTLGERQLSRWRDYHIVVLRENDFVGLTTLLRGSAFQASVKLFTVDLKLIETAAPFLLPLPPPHPKLYRDAMFPHRILDDEHLYLGSMDAAKNPLLPYFCQRVVDASNLDRAVHAERGVEYLHVKVWDDDGENIAEWFVESSDFIEAGLRVKQGVQVNCAAGVSRSTTLVLAFLISRRGMTLRAAYEHVKARRSIVCPNPGFCRQLLRFEKEIHGQLSLPEPGSWYFTLDDLIRRQKNAERN